MTRVGAMIKRDVAPEDVPALATAAAPGLDEIWIIEDLTWAGGISQLGAVLEATASDAAGSPRVGHGIAPAPFRNPAALAMEWATLDRLHEGRVIGGIGHGVPSWMKQLGETVGSPLTLLRETIEATQQLLTGELVDYSGRYITVDGVQLVFPPTDHVPIYAGVTGPRGLHLSGEIAAGTVLAEGFTPAQVEGMRATIDEGREAATRTDRHQLVVFAGFYCGDVSVLPPPPPDVPDGWAAVGPDPSAVIGELQQLVDAGVDSLVIVPFGPDEEQIRVFADEVAPQLRL